MTLGRGSRGKRDDEKFGKKEEINPLRVVIGDQMK